MSFPGELILKTKSENISQSWQIVKILLLFWLGDTRYSTVVTCGQIYCKPDSVSRTMQNRTNAQLCPMFTMIIVQRDRGNTTDRILFSHFDIIFSPNISPAASARHRCPAVTPILLPLPPLARRRIPLSSRRNPLCRALSPISSRC